MLRDVNITISDGALSGARSAVGIHAKIGVSPITSEDAVLIRGSMSAKRIRELLGNSPLADACLDSVENGADTIYCIPVAFTTAGSAGAVTSDKTGTGTLTVSGTPHNIYQVAARVSKGGELNEAAVEISINGGSSWSAEQTIPTGGVIALAGTGLTLTFAAGESGFVKGDSYRFVTTAPAAANEAILAAVDKLRRINAVIEYCHIVGASDAALWAACGTLGGEFHQTHRRPIFFVLEAAPPTEGQAAATYSAALAAASADVNERYLQVSAAYGVYTRMDGVSQPVNLAGLICGLYARARVQQSIGETRSFEISSGKLTRLLPAGIEDHIDALDAAHFVTVRRYEGLTGWYVTNARMMVADGSDYRYAERVRVTNKIVRDVRARMLLQLQTQVDVSRLDAELAAIAEIAMIPLEEMIDAKAISSARVVVPEGQDILGTETLHLVIRYVPVGHVREIEIDLGMENPYGRRNTNA